MRAAAHLSTAHVLALKRGVSRIRRIYLQWTFAKLKKTAYLYNEARILVQRMLSRLKGSSTTKAFVAWRLRTLEERAAGHLAQSCSRDFESLTEDRKRQVRRIAKKVRSSQLLKGFTTLKEHASHYAKATTFICRFLAKRTGSSVTLAFVSWRMTTVKMRAAAHLSTAHVLALKRGVSRIRRIYLQWTFAKLKRTAYLYNEARILVQRMLSRLKGSSITMAFVVWRVTTVELRASQHLVESRARERDNLTRLRAGAVKRAAQKLKCLYMHSAFAKLKRFAYYYAEARILVGRLLARRSSTSVTLSFFAWRLETTRLRAADHLSDAHLGALRRSLTRLRRLSLQWGFRRFSKAVYFYNEARILVKRVLSRLKGSSMTMAFVVWRVMAVEARASAHAREWRAKSLGRFVSRLHYLQQHRAMATLKAHAYDYRQARGLMTRVLSRLKGASLAVSFVAWRLRTVEARAAAHVQGWRARGLARVVARSRLLWLRRALHVLRASARTRAKARLLIGHMLARLKCSSVGMSLVTWRVATLEARHDAHRQEMTSRESAREAAFEADRLEGESALQAGKVALKMAREELEAKRRHYENLEKRLVATEEASESEERSTVAAAANHEKSELRAQEAERLAESTLASFEAERLRLLALDAKTTADLARLEARTEELDRRERDQPGELAQAATRMEEAAAAHEEAKRVDAAARAAQIEATTAVEALRVEATEAQRAVEAAVKKHEEAKRVDASERAAEIESAMAAVETLRVEASEAQRAAEAARSAETEHARNVEEHARKVESLQGEATKLQESAEASRAAEEAARAKTAELRRFISTAINSERQRQAKVLEKEKREDAARKERFSAEEKRVDELITKKKQELLEQKRELLEQKRELLEQKRELLEQQQQQQQQHEEVAKKHEDAAKKKKILDKEEEVAHLVRLEDNAKKQKSDAEEEKDRQHKEELQEVQERAAAAFLAGEQQQRAVAEKRAVEAEEGLVVARAVADKRREEAVASMSEARNALAKSARDAEKLRRALAAEAATAMAGEARYAAIAASTASGEAHRATLRERVALAQAEREVAMRRAAQEHRRAEEIKRQFEVEKQENKSRTAAAVEEVKRESRDLKRALKRAHADLKDQHTSSSAETTLLLRSSQDAENSNRLLQSQHADLEKQKEAVDEEKRRLAQERAQILASATEATKALELGREELRLSRQRTDADASAVARAQEAASLVIAASATSPQRGHHRRRRRNEESESSSDYGGGATSRGSVESSQFMPRRQGGHVSAGDWLDEEAAEALSELRTPPRRNNSPQQQQQPTSSERRHAPSPRGSPPQRSSPSSSARRRGSHPASPQNFYPTSPPGVREESEEEEDDSECRAELRGACHSRRRSMARATMLLFSHADRRRTGRAASLLSERRLKHNALQAWLDASRRRKARQQQQTASS